MIKKIAAIFSAYALFAVSMFAACATVTVNNQCIFTDAAPTISVCGVSPSAASPASSNGGIITVGAATLDEYGHPIPVTNCTLTFATAFTAAPTVTVSSYQSGLQVTVLKVSTTLVVVRFSVPAQGLKFTYTAF